MRKENPYVKVYVKGKIMTPEQIKLHKENPHVRLYVKGKRFYCKCGANLFHHPSDDADRYQCNGCARCFTCED